MKSIDLTELKKYLDNVILDGCPVTPEQFICTIIFLGSLIMNAITNKYCRGMLPIPEDTEINWPEVDALLLINPNLENICHLNTVVTQACDVYKLVHPDDVVKSGEISFKEWFKKTAEECNRKMTYNDYLFSKLSIFSKKRT